MNKFCEILYFCFVGPKNVSFIQLWPTYKIFLETKKVQKNLINRFK